MARRHFTTVRPAKLRHRLGTRVRVLVGEVFLEYVAEVVGYTASKSPHYGLRFIDHPWQDKQSDMCWYFAEHEVELAE